MKPPNQPMAARHSSTAAYASKGEAGLTEDARQFTRTCRELDRSGYAWEATSTHLPEYRQDRTTVGDATHLPSWPGP